MSNHENIDRVQSREFREELQALLNRHSIDDAMDMPDYVLASWIVTDLVNALTHHDMRLTWQGRDRWTPFDNAPELKEPLHV